MRARCFLQKTFHRGFRKKDGRTVLSAFRRIMIASSNKPKTILVDKGGEFTNENFKNIVLIKGLN